MTAMAEPAADQPGPGLAAGVPVAVVGAGLMGAQIGLEYALAGHPTTLVNRTPESAARAIQRAADAAAVLQRADLLAEQAGRDALARLAPASELDRSVAGAALVVESIAEDFDAKVAILRRIARHADDAVIVTNTSSLPVTALGDASDTSLRLVGTHYWNPPTLMPLVEVIPGGGTDPAVLSLVTATLKTMGKQPVTAPDIPGFIWNRLQFALMREAVGLVRRHGIEPETIDLVIRQGLGRRWSAVGPFETMALGGQATFASVANWLLPQLIADLDPAEFAAIRLPGAGATDAARRARDGKLTEFLRSDRGLRRE